MLRFRFWIEIYFFPLILATLVLIIKIKIVSNSMEIILVSDERMLADGVKKRSGYRYGAGYNFTY